MLHRDPFGLTQTDSFDDWAPANVGSERLLVVFSLGGGAVGRFWNYL